MSDIVIENPIINSPDVEPTRRFLFSDEGITNQIVKGRRPLSYFIPIPRPKMKGKQLTLETQWTADRILANALINRIRDNVGVWRAKGRPGVTATTRRLLDYWTLPDRERPLFFCQIEALETAIYLAEVADPQGISADRTDIVAANESTNPDLFRIAFKMVTGTGKTVVIGMLIAWQAFNRRANPKDPRFSDAFLILTPGITIKDRLRVFYPNDADNYYWQSDFVPADLVPQLGEAKIFVTNYHIFLPRETIAAGKLTKTVLGKGSEDTFTETPAQVVRRACRSFGRKRNLLVINDEAYHCYRRKDTQNGEKLSGDEKREATERDEAARGWLSGLEAIQHERGIRTVYDLSATPFFLKGPGWPDGTIAVRLRGVDVYDPTTGDVRSSDGTKDIACWFIDTDYDGESFFVRHAYFTGADQPYERLKKALRAEVDEGAWAMLYRNESRPFSRPKRGQIAVKVINHYGDEVLKVFGV